MTGIEDSIATSEDKKAIRELTIHYRHAITITTGPAISSEQRRCLLGSIQEVV